MNEPEQSEEIAGRVDPPDPRRRSIQLTPDDTARLILAFTFVALFALTIFFACIAVIADGSAWSKARELLQVILPAETALLGSAVGFYFGARRPPG